MPEHADSGQNITIAVHNEDNGSNYEFNAGPGTPISAIITRLYSEKLRRERQNDDRLRCELSGEDVFAFTALHLRDYFEQGHCRDGKWVFVGGTGGAA